MSKADNLIDLINEKIDIKASDFVSRNVSDTIEIKDIVNNLALELLKKKGISKIDKIVLGKSKPSKDGGFEFSDVSIGVKSKEGLEIIEAKVTLAFQPLGVSSFVPKVMLVFKV